MAAASREGSSPASTTGIITAILVLAGAIFVTQQPLVGSRPKTADPLAHQPPTAADVQARLWQDPLAVAARHREDVARTKRDDLCPSGPDANACHEPEVLQQHAFRNALDHVKLLIVPVFGGSYAEDSEYRRRTRYAVLSALAVAGYIPDDPTHIGYVDMTTAGGSKASAFLPFESFTASEPDGSRRLLLTWPEEQPWAPLQIARLANIVKTVDGWCDEDTPPRLEVSILGPVSSDSLLSMQRELDALGVSPDESSAQPYACLVGARVYSYSATAPQASGLDDMVTLFARLKVQFLRTVTTDKQVAASLVEELRRRRVGGAGDHVILVSEWDSKYARDFQESLTEQFCAPKPDATRCRRRIHRFSYLRGLDGIIPSSARPAPDSQAQREKDDQRKDGDTAALERADGDSQFDYLRRLADRIDRLDRERFQMSNLAIGVIGTDVYDKLLVLQVLRPRFPGALFFTTDLDARLLHPKELPWTRNLVVVSSFGLQVHERLQRDIPPFRDTYQTSAFFAVSADLRDDNPCSVETTTLSALNRQGCFDRYLQPRLFEIGRGVAFDLSPSLRDTDGKPRRNLVHPWRRPFFPHVRLLTAGALGMTVLTGLVLAFSASLTLRGLARRVAGWTAATRGHVATAGLGLTSIAVVVAVIAWRIGAEGENGEPFTLTGGISVWPTELLRIAAALLAIGFFAKVWADLQVLTAELTAKFFPDMVQSLDARTLRLSRLLRGPERWATLKAVYAAGPTTPKKAAAIDVERLWSDYVFQISPVSRMARILPLGAVFYLLGLAAMLVLGMPHIPSRGGMSFWIDRVVMLGISVPSFILLLFSVVDSIRLCDRFTRELARAPRTAWPEKTRRAFQEESGIPEDQEPVYRWIDIRFVARWTVGLSNTIYYPFLVMLVTLLARSSMFDNWEMPLGLLVVLGASLLYATASAVILHRAAERGRRVVIERLTNELLRAKGDVSPDKSLAPQLALMIEEVRAIDDGAFAPLLQQPAVRAALLPLGGAGSSLLLEYLFKLI